MNALEEEVEAFHLKRGFFFPGCVVFCWLLGSYNDKRITFILALPPPPSPPLLRESLKDLNFEFTFFMPKMTVL